ncbi:hypothetical protein AAKU61_001670 [Undibacterium sp. GrIS 1.2]|uniref:hypothetical protein n=1 Tax=Undibacterium sp. GrIS 1.2 TaxID=3143933 RepID=UPI0033947C14
MRTITSFNMLAKSLALGVLVVGAGISGTASAQDRDWNRGGWHQPQYRHEVVHNYNYVYYPAQRVYYSPNNGNWFWANGGNWQAGARLPGYLNVDLRLGGVPVVLGSDRPYMQHAYVEQTYGQPWRTAHYQRTYYDNRYGRWDGYRDDHRYERHEHDDHDNYRDRHDDYQRGDEHYHNR